MYKKGVKRDSSNRRGISVLSTTYKMYPVSCCQGLPLMQKKLLGIINVEIEVQGYLLNVYSAVVIYLKKRIKRSSASPVYRHNDILWFS